MFRTITQLALNKNTYRSSLKAKAVCLNQRTKASNFYSTLVTRNNLNNNKISRPTMDTKNMAYSNCNTRVIDLKSLNLPENASESEYRNIYKTYVHEHPNSDLEAAVRSLTTGIAPPVAFPTETVYGLGADATNAPAVSGIFAAKDRPVDNPLIVHVANKEHLERLTGEPVPEIYEKLIQKHWPGPLTTLIPLPSSSKTTFAHNVHPGQKTIGFRVPNSKYARFLISACDRPLAAPSANSSGRPSPTSAKHVKDDLNGKINFILDGGSCEVGVESTVVDGLSDPPMILRPGGVSRWDLIEFGKQTGTKWEHVVNGYNEHAYHENSGTLIDTDDANSGTDSAPRAPGMKYKHYAPRGKLYLFTESSTSCEPGAIAAHIASIVSSHTSHSPQPQQIHTSPTVTAGPLGRTMISGPPPPPTMTLAILTTSSWSKKIDVAKHVLPALSRSAGSASLSARPSVQKMSLGESSTAIAQQLFATLRSCDDIGAEVIIVEAPARTAAEGGAEDKDWEVVMERLGKAAGGNIVHSLDKN